jgi:uncharacterized protein YdhG (YjbR/CyaY superfamily)
MTPNTAKNIDDYIANFPEREQTKMQQLRRIIHEAAPGLVETISYQMPTFDMNGKHLVYFGCFKQHIGFFPFPSGVTEFLKLTSDYVTSKGTIQFPHEKPLPVELIKKIIRFRIQDNAERAALKKKK